MANETTTTTLATLTNATLVEPVIILALQETPGLYRFCREFSAIGKPTSALKIANQTSYWGSVNDHGGGTDTEFDATQASALANTAVSSGSVTLTATEYGIAHSLTDNVGEDSVLQGTELMDLFTGQMLAVLGMAMDYDYISLYSGLSNNVGTSGQALTVAQMISAHQGLMTRSAETDAQTFVLDNKQIVNVEAALIATSTSAAAYALSADRLIGYAPAPGYGASPSRKVMTFRGADVFKSGLTSTANGAVDVVGACISPSTSLNDKTGATTHGMVWKRLPRFETQRQAKSRANDLVMTCRAGFVELQDGSGTSITTIA